MSLYDKADTIRWLEDRKENCLRISRTKTGKDREGWVEDACYFNAAIVHLRGAKQMTQHQQAKGTP
jgi:hypothetical protein